MSVTCEWNDFSAARGLFDLTPAFCVPSANESVLHGGHTPQASVLAGGANKAVAECCGSDRGGACACGGSGCGRGESTMAYLRSLRWLTAVLVATALAQGACVRAPRTPLYRKPGHVLRMCWRAARVVRVCAWRCCGWWGSLRGVTAPRIQHAVHVRVMAHASTPGVPTPDRRATRSGWHCMWRPWLALC